MTSCPSAASREDVETAFDRPRDSKSHSFLVEGAGLLEELLSLTGLSTAGAESLDTEGTTGLLESGSPLQDLLSVLERVWEGSFMVVLKLIRSGRRR